jgi:hypothetical protein
LRACESAEHVTAQVLPALVVACVQYLIREEEATNQDVFVEQVRASWCTCAESIACTRATAQGDPGVMQECKNQFETGRRPDLSAMGSHNVAGLLWLWCVLRVYRRDQGSAHSPRTG